MMEAILSRKAAAALAVLLLTLVFASESPADATTDQILNRAQRLQLPFIENRGQLKNDDVAFYAKTFGGTVFVERDGTLTY